MQLCDALAIKRGDIVAFIGAGGKTTSLVRLSRELAGKGWRVLVTTTTRIAVTELALFPVSCSQEETCGESLDRLLDQHRCVFVYAHLVGEKVIGLSREAAGALMRAARADVLLIEADGARRMPLKAPHSHEPVVPETTTLVVNVCGYGALGQPLDDAHVYNARGLADEAGVKVGSRIGLRVFVAALSMGAYGFSNFDRRFVALLNAVPQTDHHRVLARRIARIVLRPFDFDGVVIGSADDVATVDYEVRSQVGAIVLAAGLSTRMGRQKVLLPWCNNETVLQHVIRQLKLGGVTGILVVTGADREPVQQIARLSDAYTVHNADYASGEMLSSLQVGLRNMFLSDQAALIVLGDQPSIRHQNVRKVLDAYALGQGTIIAPSHAMKRGHPILIDRKFWQELLDLSPGSAPRDVINRHSDEIGYVMTDDSVLRDIDTPEAYAEERRRAFGV